VKYGAMFHHFHDGLKHKESQGSIGLEEFREILDFLGSNYEVLSPDEYLFRFEENGLKSNNVCLTFDDALKCQFDIALPELERRGLKAFFFVYSGAFSETPPPLEFYREFRNNYFDNIDDFYSGFFDLVDHSFPHQYSKFLIDFSPTYLDAFPFYTLNDRKFRFIRDVVLGN
jgi:hypothetical protein